MSTRIRILPEGLVNKIAAGEVVERPASVIKELVENSLDAGATRIDVEVRGGGKSLLRVSDDGLGMSREDALLCIERHATSKIRNDEDLFAIHSLGFRGEALPSIAGVSRFEIRTCLHGAEAGTRLRLEGGVLREVSESEAAPGTEITVRSLFFNVPVRLKFLRGDRTEHAHVLEAVVREALAHPHVAFTVTGGDSEAIRAPRTESLRRRVQDLLGKQVAQSLHEISASHGDVSVEGLISDPSLTRSTREGLYLYVNGRFVRDKLVSAAVAEAYQGVIPRGRYPVMVLSVRLPPDLVDVNVHPTKTEVRFVRPQEVFQAVMAPLRDSFRDVAAAVYSTPEARPRVERGQDFRTLSPELPFSREETSAGPSSSPPSTYLHDIAWEVETPSPPGMEASREWSPPLRPTPPLPLSEEEGGESSRESGPSLPPQARWVSPPSPLEPAPETPASSTHFARREGGAGTRFQDLQILGQYDLTYLLCQDGTDLVLIDQHAAHERVTFERIRALADGLGGASQMLLVPEVLDLPRAQAQALLERRELLAELGLEVDDYGGESVAVKSLPPGVSSARMRRLITDLAQELMGEEVPRAVQDLKYLLASLMACHCAVRAQDRLNREAILSLLKQLDQVDFSFACPHGRPLMVKFPRRDVERWFARS